MSSHEKLSVVGEMNDQRSSRLRRPGSSMTSPSNDPVAVDIVDMVQPPSRPGSAMSGISYASPGMFISSL